MLLIVRILGFGCWDWDWQEVWYAAEEGRAETTKDGYKD
jgi:hypothetical protein